MKIFLAIVLIIALLFSLSFLNWQASFLKNITYNWVARPLIFGVNFLGEKVSVVPSFFSGMFFRAQEKEDLEMMILALRAQNVRLREIVRENDFLKNSLKIEEQEQNNFILAKVVAKDQDNTSSVLIINKGSKQGVAEGQAVILGPAVLLGSIFEVYDNFSKIRLLTDPQSRVNVIVQDKDLQGVVAGQYGLSLLLEKVTWDKNLEVGDKIISSGLGRDFPSGLFVGEIEQESKDKTDIYQSARVRPAAEVEVLDFVFIFK